MQIPAFNARIPPGPLAHKWQRFLEDSALTGPANRRRYRVIVVGTGLAGASAAATLAELGYQVEAFSFHDSPRRAHSIAAQGGINAAKNYRNDGDSVERLFRDTVRGGDYRSREANVYRLAELSNRIIDHCVAQGIPFARDYAGYLDNRSFGGALVARTFYARGQTGQQLLLGAYGALSRQIHEGRVTLHNRTEMLDLVVDDGRAAGIVTRHLTDGTIRRHAADAIVLATGGYSNIYYLSTNALASNVTATYRAYRRGAWFANPSFTQIHPTCIPAVEDHQSKLTLMSESLRNDGRIWVPLTADDTRAPADIPEVERDYYLERLYPRYGNLSPRDISSRAAKAVCDEGRGVGPTGQGVYLDFADAIGRVGRRVIDDRYGNLFDMYRRITGEDPWQVPMRIYPAAHYTMGGLWVDYHLMTTLPGLFAIGEANFSDHGANRLGASALMQGLADGYFILPQTLGDYLARQAPRPDTTDTGAFAEAERSVGERLQRLVDVGGRTPVESIHRRLGELMSEYCGMSRSREGLQRALNELPALREEFWSGICVCGGSDEFNIALEKAGRVADYLEFAEVMIRDALAREESCGAHFREEYQTADGEALRDDRQFAHVATWGFRGDGEAPQRATEALAFEHLQPATRDYR
ncbi:MAG: fumarate reductase/succinate dehydrogenase flavoprotein subunit [Gammaproteobacteria bacterium]|nr:fumarate reductase/succinate dehydrogenase flavoprotein subunit [Gammaproteobacteria bacterium]